MKTSNHSRQSAGAMMAWTIGCSILFTFIAITFFYIVGICSGDKQLINATDAGALAAAQQIAGISLSNTEVTALAASCPEFMNLGVDPNGNVCNSGSYIDANGNTQPALFNIIAYNNCAAYTLEIAFNAANAANASADGSPAAINAANTIIMGLNTFAQELTADIQTATLPATATSPAGAIGSAASNLIESNSMNNLPDQLFGGTANSPSLQPNSLKIAYYADSDPHAQLFFPPAFSSPNPANPTFTNWVNQVLSNTASSNNGPNFIKAATPFDINTITNQTGFVDKNGNDLVIALVPFQTQEPTHLVTTSQGNRFSTSALNTSSAINNYSLPPNAVQLVGLNIENSNSGSSNGLLTALSAAVANIANNSVQYPAYYPNSPTPPVTGTTVTTGGNTTTTSTGGSTAYVAIINGGDYNAYVPGLKQGATLDATTNIGFDDSTPDIFDIMSRVDQSGWIFVGTDSPTGMYDLLNKCFTNPDISYSSPIQLVNYYEQTFAQNNYNNVVDNTNLTSTPPSTTPSMPFILISDPSIATGNYTSLQNALKAFQPWILYNLSANTTAGTDGLMRDPSKDPLGPGGSPALFSANANSMVPNTSIKATSIPGQGPTIADLLKVVDFNVLVSTPNSEMEQLGSLDSLSAQFVGINCLGGPSWEISLLSVVAGNCGIPYLPTTLPETRPNGRTAIEWLKDEFLVNHGGAGLSAAGLISIPGHSQAALWLPCSITDIGWLWTSVSGIKGFQPYTTAGTRAHYQIPEPAGCPKFETPDTPLHYLQNMNILNHNGTLSSNDTLYNNLLSYLLNAVQGMNSNITMNDLTTALNSAPMDLNQRFFLVYDSTQQKLIMVNSLAGIGTYQPVNSSQPPVPYSATYEIAGSPTSGNTNNYPAMEQLADPSKTLIGTSADPTGQIKLANGNVVCPAPTGDCNLPEGPYAFFATPVCAKDTASYSFASAGNNRGELRFSESLIGTGASAGWRNFNPNY